MPFQNDESPTAIKAYGDVTIDPSGIVSAPTGNFQNLTLGGRDVRAIIADQDRNAKGVTWTHSLYGSMPWNYDGSVAIVNRYFRSEQGRRYTLMIPPTMWVFTDYTKVTGALIEAKITRPNGEIVILQNFDMIVANNRGYIVCPGGPMSFAMPVVNGPEDWLVQITAFNGLSSGGGFRLIPFVGQNRRVEIVDNGHSDQAAYSFTDIGTLGSGGPAPTPQPTSRVYTGNFRADLYKNYAVNSGAEVNYPGLLRQSTNGTVRAGFNVFNTNNEHGHSLGTLAGGNCNVQAATLIIGETDYSGAMPVRWYFTAGGRGRIYWHNNASLGSTMPGYTFFREIRNWGNNQVIGTDFDAGLINLLNTGGFKGIAMSGQGVGGQDTYHGEFPYRSRLNIRYELTS